MAGEASGALIGLLFVAVSINRERIVKHPELRASAVQSLLVFLLPLIVSVLLLTPWQPVRALGIELIALGALHGLALAIAGHRKSKADEKSRLAELLDHTNPSLLTTLCVLTCGGLLAAGMVAGLYFLVPAVILAIFGGVANAWLFLVRDPD